jgi:hypothetical protein
VKNKINDGHYLELMDRLHIVMMNIDYFIGSHPLTKDSPDIQKKVEKAFKHLWDAYQLVGEKDYEREQKNNPITKVVLGRHKKSKD